jgi:HTH-type transcriptional regulator / antitoxin HigA
VELSNPNNAKPPSPGEFIRDELRVREWTQEDLARIIGRPLPTVNEIIRGKRAVMPEMAIALGTAFGTTAELWMQREGLYRLSLAVGDSQDEIKHRARLYELAPINHHAGGTGVRTQAILWCG